MTRRFACAALALATIAGWSSVAFAEDPRVAAARRAYDELRYEDVLVAVAAARREGTLAREDEVELTRLEAYTFAVFDDEPHAVEAFRRLLALDPAFAPENVSPKIRAYFERARRPPQPSTQGSRRVLGATPSPEAPQPRPRSWLTSPWLWGAVGVVVVIGGAGAFVLYDRRGPPAADGNLGRLELR